MCKTVVLHRKINLTRVHLKQIAYVSEQNSNPRSRTRQRTGWKQHEQRTRQQLLFQKRTPGSKRHRGAGNDGQRNTAARQQRRRTATTKTAHHTARKTGCRIPVLCFQNSCRRVLASADWPQHYRTKRRLRHTARRRHRVGQPCRNRGETAGGQR